MDVYLLQIQIGLAAFRCSQFFPNKYDPQEKNKTSLVYI